MGLSLLHFVLLLVGAVMVLAVIARRLQVAPAVAFVIGGMGLALTPHQSTVSVDPELVMALFLPPLLQSAAFFTVWREFKAALAPILTLALGAVLFTTVVVAVAAKLVAPGLSWAACFALGAIVSPPDAVSASAILKRMRLPRRLSTILEGESLVNDASGLVLYRFAVAAALSGTFSLTAAAGNFVLVAVGGVAVGFVCGKVFFILVRRLRDTNLEIAATFGAAYVSYLSAESVHVSGVLATVTCGLIMGAAQHAVFSSRTRLKAQAAWAFTTFLLEALVFVLIGLELREILQRISVSDVSHILFVCLVVVAATIVSRFVWVYAATYLPLLTARGRSGERPSAGAALVVSWTGMRGVVSLAAALALPMSFPGRDLVLLATFAVIVVTILVQGTTLPGVIRFSKQSAGDGEEDRAELGRVRKAVAEAELAYVQVRHSDSASVAGEIADELRWRLHALGQTQTAAREEREARFRLRIGAIQAGRDKLLALHGTGAVNDENLRIVERDLDLLEDRFRGLLGGGSAEG